MIAKKESHMWSNNVTVLFNPTAYNNELIFNQFIYEELIRVLHHTVIQHPLAPATSTSLSHPPPNTENSRPLAYHPSQSSTYTSVPTSMPIRIPTGNHTTSEVRDTFQTPATNLIPNSYIPYSLLLMDRAAFHVTPAILSTLRSHRIIPSIIPGGCTGLLQPLDTAVNKPFKEYLREYTDIYLDEQAVNGHDMTTSSVSDKRILTTHVVARAWSAFCQQKPYLIRKAFRDVGVTLPISGSCDDEIHIKGFTAAEVALGDWRSDLPIPIAESQEASESFRTLPAETEEYNNLHYVWTCEGYQSHTAQSNIVPPCQH